MQGEWLVPMMWWWFPGGGTRLVLWGAGLPAQQLECAGWLAGTHLCHRHPGIHGLRQWHQDPWHAESATAATDPASTQVTPPPFLTSTPTREQNSLCALPPGYDPTGNSVFHFRQHSSHCSGHFPPDCELCTLLSSAAHRVHSHCELCTLLFSAAHTSVQVSSLGNTI